MNKEELEILAKVLPDEWGAVTSKSGEYLLGHCCSWQRWDGLSENPNLAFALWDLLREEMKITVDVGDSGSEFWVLRRTPNTAKRSGGATRTEALARAYLSYKEQP